MLPTAFGYTACYTCFSGTGHYCWGKHQAGGAACTDLAWELELAAKMGAQEFGMCPAPQQANIHRVLLFVDCDAEQSQRPQVVEQAGDPQCRKAALIVPDAVNGAFLREQACRGRERQLRAVQRVTSPGKQSLLL